MSVSKQMLGTPRYAPSKLLIYSLTHTVHMSYYISEMEEKDLRSDEDSNQEKEEGSNKEPEQTKSDEDWRPEEEESGSMRRKRQVCRKRSTDFEGNLTHGKPRFSIWDHSSPIHLDVLYKGGEGEGRALKDLSILALFKVISTVFGTDLPGNPA